MKLHFSSELFCSRPQWSEVLAGFTLVALGAPEVMGYTQIIGTPVWTGLYTMLLPLLVFAVIGSSRHLVVSADSATAAIVAATLLPIASRTGANYVALTSVVALLAGAMLAMAAFLRLGFVANFLSRTVLVGFLAGVGLQVALGQLPLLLGLEKNGSDVLTTTVHVLGQWRDVRWCSPTLAFAVVVLILVGERFLRRLPVPLIAVVLSIVAVHFGLDWASLGVRVVGPVAAGLPRWNWPEMTFSQLTELLPVAFSCFAVILAQSAATSRLYSLRYRDKFSENRDLWGLAGANLAAAVSGTFVVNGSPTKTAMVEAAGGRSQWSQVVAALVMILILLFFTEPLSQLPHPVLAAIVFVIGLRLIDLASLRDIWRKRPSEFWLALLTATTVLSMGVERGIGLSLVLSLLLHVQRSYQPQSSVLVGDVKGHWHPEPVASGIRAFPTLVVYWFGADLFYANVEAFVKDVTALMSPREGTPPQTLVIDGGAITSVDYTATSALLQLRSDLTAHRQRWFWVHLTEPAVRELQNLGVLEAGEYVETLHECVDRLGLKVSDSRTSS